MDVMDESVKMNQAENGNYAGGAESARTKLMAGAWSGRLRKVLVANRGEIARRFFFALREAGIASVAIVTEPDREQSWSDAADEVVFIGDGDQYTSIPAVLSAARSSGANAIYPGYGFLSENPELPAAIEEANATSDLIFMGPPAEVMRRVGHKLDARALARAHGVPIFEGSDSFAPDQELDDCIVAVREAAAAVGFPVILKLNAGGGGKGMEIVEAPEALPEAVESIRRVGRSNYGDATFYLERYIVEPVHIEVQIFNEAAVGIRKCAVQRRNQKVVEESGESLLEAGQIRELFEAAERMAAASGYAEHRAGAGTVEFLYDAARGSFGFLEMNTRLQVEYAVTGLSRNIDLVAWQIENFQRPDFEVRSRFSAAVKSSSGSSAESASGNTDETAAKNPVDTAARPALAAHAIQCRVYAEDAFRDYAPAPGRITELELPAFHGVRCDFGFQAGDDVVGRYDPMIGKLLAWGPDRETALLRMERALGELYIQGVTTNLDQLLRIVRHPVFRSGRYDNRLLDKYPELHDAGAGPDAALKVEAAIFGCADFARRAATEIYRDFFYGDGESGPGAPGVSSADLRRLLEDTRLSGLPSRFRATLCGERLRIELVQVGGGSYYVYVDDRYSGLLHFQNANRFAHDEALSERRPARPLRVRFGGRSYRLRTEERAGVTRVRCTEAGGRVNYFRMRIEAMNGGGPEPDPAGMVRAPFRGTFVSLGRRQQSSENEADAAPELRPGDRVSAGQAVITLSAMKMETRIFAPCDGVLSFMVDEGRLDRLVLGHTPDGLVQGKSIAEGDVLFVVAPDRIAAGVADTDDASGMNMETHADDGAADERNEASRNLLDHLHRDTLLRVFDSNSRNHIRIVLGLARAALFGWVQDRAIIENVLRVLEGPGDAAFQHDGLLRKETEGILRSFLYLRRAFAPEGASSLLQLRDLDRLLAGRASPVPGQSEDPGSAARYSVTATFDHFARECGYERPLAAQNRRGVLFEMLRMYRAGNQQTALLLPLIARWSRGTPESAARPLLNRLLQSVSKYSGSARHGGNARAEERLEERLRGILQEFQGRAPRFRETDPVYSRNHLGAYRSFIEEPLRLLTDYRSTSAGRRDELRAALDRAASEQDDQLLPAWLPAELAGEVRERLEILAHRYRVTLVSFDAAGSLVVYRLVDRADANDRGYLCLAWPHEGRMIGEYAVSETSGANSEATAGRLVGAPNIESCVLRAAAMLAACRRELEASPPESGANADSELYNWYRLEILACTNPSPVDLTSPDPGVWNRQNLKELASKLMLFFTRIELRLLSIEVDALNPRSGSRRRMHLSFYMRAGEMRVALLVPEDPRHPYHSSRAGAVVDDHEARNARLFAKGKWPAEIWAREAFDDGAVEELRIPSIDEPPAGSSSPVVVGARLYRGRMSGRPAWFFLKDSRRNGGATGDREGRKFVAAAYLAYLHNAPLYVWNDGAGANIKEGMVALNRAAQGFMMNALVAGAVSYQKFFEYTRKSADPVLADLFSELDRQFRIADFSRRAGRPDNVFLVAIGVGSSTGLDVYGSSQASVQILLDSEQSYRVLTGSSVIRSVTGEDLTNYEIGGARVMGRETGTADIIALDRLDLLSRLRSVHELFSAAETVAAGPPDLIQADGTPGESDAGRPMEFCESFLSTVGDTGDFLPFKEEYAGSESLLGGFLRLGGSSALVLGPRTEFGTSTEAAATRARELFRVAQKTSSHTVLVSGATWHRLNPGSDGPSAYRRYQEFARDLGPDRRRGLLILICTEARAVLERIELTAQADAIIFVDSSSLSGGEDAASPADAERDTARRLATFCAADLQAAFGIARRLIAALQPAGESAQAGVDADHAQTNGRLRRPALPADPSAPFDMVGDIIDAVFDSNSYFEFYSDGDLAGQVQSLCTGLARLGGRTVALIADQPVQGGAPDAPGTEKFRIFMEFVARFRLPLVMLSSAPGFVPGMKQERLRIQQIGGESLDVNVLSECPVVSVVLNQNFGGRQIHAFSKFLRPGVAYAALDRSVLAVMGAAAAFDLFHGRRYAALQAAGQTEEARTLRAESMAAFETKSRADHDAAATGLIDIPLADESGIRSALFAGLRLAEARLRGESVTMLRSD